VRVYLRVGSRSHTSKSRHLWGLSDGQLELFEDYGPARDSKADGYTIDTAAEIAKQSSR